MSSVFLVVVVVVIVVAAGISSIPYDPIGNFMLPKIMHRQSSGVIKFLYREAVRYETINYVLDKVWPHPPSRRKNKFRLTATCRSSCSMLQDRTEWFNASLREEVIVIFIFIVFVCDFAGIFTSLAIIIVLVTTTKWKQYSINV